MKTKQTGTFPYPPSVEKDMKAFYNSLNEKDKRHYSAIESKKLRHGGITYISNLFNCDRSTIQNGLEELKKKNFYQ